MDGRMSDITGLVKSEAINDGINDSTGRKIELPKPNLTKSYKKSNSPKLNGQMAVAMPENTIKNEIDYTETIMNKRDARPAKRQV